jgi:deoxyribonuclease V
LPSSWPDSPEELERLQLRVAAEAASTRLWTPPQEPIVGAVFAATRRGFAGQGEPGDPAWVAAVAMRNGKVLGWTVVRGHFPAPYQPGRLALREGALLERAVRALEPQPEVLIVNATGPDHPRAAGLALHLGWALDLPTIGVTDPPTAATIVEPLLDKRTPAPLREARRLARTARANDT